MSKRWSIVITLCFFLPLAGVGLYSLWDQDDAESKEENRTLEQKPEFSLEALFRGNWTEDFTEYYTDQFPGRETLIGAGRTFDNFLYIPLPEEDNVVFIGGDFDLGEGEGMDFSEPSPPEEKPSPEPAAASPSPEVSPSPGETSPSGEASPSPEPEPSPSPTPEPEVDLETGGYLIVGDRILHMSYASETNNRVYADMLGRFQDALPETRLISMVVPNSYPFYAPSSYTTGARDQRRMIETLYGMLDERIVAVDAFTPIAKHKDEYLYFRSDHHWTARGAYWAYTGFCEAMGYEPSDISEWETGQYDNFLGSFYAQVKNQPGSAAVSENPDICEYFIPPTVTVGTRYADGTMQNGQPIPVINTVLNGGNKYECFIGGDQPVIHFQTEAVNGQSIAVVKESYGNALIPFLLAHYEDVYVIDYRKFNYKPELPKLAIADFVADNEIDDVMLVSYPYIPNERITTDRLLLMFP